MFGMNRIYGALLLLLIPLGVSAQSTQPSKDESTSRPQTPDSPPSPPDAPIPDKGSLTVPPPKSGTKLVLKKLDPHCIDAIFHTCWSSPSAEPDKPISEQERTAANDVEVGYYYLGEKDYHAAKARLQEAVELKPDLPAALIGLAQAEQKLGERDEARQTYEAYLKLKPDGPDADKVRKALAKLR
jgi:tetratricopeptide (TPR) repeat protein